MTSSSPLALFSSLDQKPGMPFLGRLSPGEGDRRLGQKHISITCSANPLSSRLARFLENRKCSVNAGSVGAVLWYWGVFIKGRAQVTREADHCDSSTSSSGQAWLAWPHNQQGHCQALFSAQFHFPWRPKG